MYPQGLRQDTVRLFLEAHEQTAFLAALDSFPVY